MLSLVRCAPAGITNYDEYSLVREIMEEKEEEVTGTLKKDKTLLRDEKKMEKLKQKLHTDDECTCLHVLGTGSACAEGSGKETWQARRGARAPLQGEDPMQGSGEDCDEGTRAHTPWSLSCVEAQGRGMRARMHQIDIHFLLCVSSPGAGTSLPWVSILAHALVLPAVNWLDHGWTLPEQGIDNNETLLLRRTFFYSNQNVDSRDPVQLNLLYVQVQPCGAPLSAVCASPLPGLVAEGFGQEPPQGALQDAQLSPGTDFLGKSQRWQSQPCPLCTLELPRGSHVSSAWYEPP